MKRKKVLLSTVALVTLLIGLSISAAASTNVAEENYCGICGVGLVSYGAHGDDYSNNHTFDYVTPDKDKVVETCHVWHSIDKIDKYCPTHGFRWSGSRHTETHSNSNCPYYRTRVYFE